MSRLAFFSPWPPQPSGIAACAADLIPELAAKGHAIDVYVDEALVHTPKHPSSPPEPGEVRVVGAHDFVWRQPRSPYDLAVYQVGNSWAHGFIWPYLFQYPGLAVLHDTRLHHARTDALMRRKRHEDYRAEFAYNHPEVAIDVAELAIRGFDGAYYYQWPMRRALMDASRAVAVHSRSAVDALRREHPGQCVEHVRLGHGVVPHDAAAARRTFRDRLGIPDDALVFGVLGTASAEKRVEQVVRAFASARQWSADARLLLAGQVDPLLPLQDLIRTHGLGDVTHVAGRLDDADFDRAVLSCDVGLNLRWPTAGEVSGPWLRMLSAGLPTVIVDSPHHGEVLTLDPRTWRCHAPEPLEPDAESRAIAVGVDILDEEHSLRLALRRLASDTELRRRLGASARTYWELNHTVAAMAADYERVMALAMSRQAPAVDLPAHLQPDPLMHTKEIVRQCTEY